MRFDRLGLALCCAAWSIVLLSGCNGSGKADTVQTGGSAAPGKQLIVRYRCGSCHNIPGIHNANGVVGPPLQMFGRRTMIAGDFPNDPDHLVHWIMAPTSMKPKTAMPVLGLSEQQARDVAAYLYTLR